MIETFNDSVKTGDELTASLISMGLEYYNFTTFAQINFTGNNPIANFLPFQCIKKSDGQTTPIIAYSGDSLYTNPVVKDLKILLKLQR